MRFGGSFVAILEEQVGNVAVHGEATCALRVDFCVIPLEVYARKTYPVKVLRDGVMGSEDSSEVVKVVVAYILNAEIINNEYKHNRAPFVTPKPWRSRGFILAIAVKARVD